MKQFLSDFADALSRVGIPAPDVAALAQRGFSEIETALMRPETFATCLRGLVGRLRTVIEAAAGRPIRHLLITPVPNYIIEFLPDFIAEFPFLTIADNFKAGTEIAGLKCLTLAEALASPDAFDGFLLATVDQRLGRLFRDQLPADLTIAAADLVWLDPASSARPRRPEVQRFLASLQGTRRPLLVLAAYLDATFAPTLDALREQGVDVFVVSRQAFSGEEGANASDPAVIAAKRYLVAEFDEMLWLLQHSDNCPVLVNYARFFASNWDLRNTIPLFGYSIAVLHAIAGPRLLHLYDAYQVSLRGLEVERLSFDLYRDLLDSADGILVNADIAPVLREFLGAEKPIISFLRYGPAAEAQPEPDPGPFSIVMITSFLGEANDPTRMTENAVRSLLLQGIHIHYYALSPTARAFQDGLAADLKPRFHLHEPVRDQRALVREISRYHAGWFVADMSCCETLSSVFSAPFAKSLADCFVPTTIATAGMLYGCAGLPTIFIKGHYTARLFAPGTAIEIELAEVGSLKQRIEALDLGAMRRDAYRARDSFSIASHIDRLGFWLERFERRD